LTGNRHFGVIYASTSEGNLGVISGIDGRDDPKPRDSAFGDIDDHCNLSGLLLPGLDTHQLHQRPFTRQADDRRFGLGATQK
jgi:hypothetical protein